MWATNASHTCNFKFSRSYIFFKKVKKEKEKGKEIGDTSFSNMFYLTQYIQSTIILTTCSVFFNEIFYILFFILSLHIEALFFYIYNTSQFGLASFQVLNRHMWLVATIWDSILLKPVWVERIELSGLGNSNPLFLTAEYIVDAILTLVSPCKEKFVIAIFSRSQQHMETHRIRLWQNEGQTSGDPQQL